MVTLSDEILSAQAARRSAEAPPAVPAPVVLAAPKKKERAVRLTSTATVKRMALGFSKAHRAGKFTRVGESFLEAIEAATRNAILSRVKQQPSVGKTLT